MGNAYVETEYDQDMDDCFVRPQKVYANVVQGEVNLGVNVNVTERGNLYDITRESKAVKGVGRSITRSRHLRKDSPTAKDASRTSDRSLIGTESGPF